MAKYNREGTLYIKNVTGVNVAADGQPVGVFAKAIPPYAVVNRFWVTCYVTGAQGLPMHAKQHMVISGRMGNMPGEIEDLSGAANYDSIEKLMGAFIPRGPSEPFDGDEAETEDVDLIQQGSDASLWSKDREFLHYEAMLGGRNAFITKSDAIRFSTSFSRKGTVSGYGCNVDQWRLIGIDVNTDGIANDINEDAMLHVWGDSTPNPNTLMRSLYQFYGDQGVADYVGGSYNASSEDNFSGDLGTPNAVRAGITQGTVGDNWSTVGNWAKTGFGHDGSWAAETRDDTDAGSGFDEDGALIVQTKVTLEIKTLKPRIRNMWTPN